MQERLYYWTLKQYKNHPPTNLFLSIDGITFGGGGAYQIKTTVLTEQLKHKKYTNLRTPTVGKCGQNLGLLRRQVPFTVSVSSVLSWSIIFSKWFGKMLRKTPPILFCG